MADVPCRAQGTGTVRLAGAIRARATMTRRSPRRAVPDWLEPALFLGGAGIFVAAFLVNYFGTPTTFHEEMINALLFFDRPAPSVWGELAKVFNVHGTELGTVRNRPVEYVVQLIGAKLFFLVNSRLPLAILHDFVTPAVLLLTALVL